MDPGYTTWVNVNKARIEGFEMAADYRNGGIGLRVGYGQTRGTDRQNGEDLTGIPANRNGEEPAGEAILLK